MSGQSNLNKQLVHLGPLLQSTALHDWEGHRWQEHEAAGSILSMVRETTADAHITADTADHLDTQYDTPAHEIMPLMLWWVFFCLKKKNP